MDSRYWQRVMADCGFNKISEKLMLAQKSSSSNIEDSAFNRISAVKVSRAKGTTMKVEDERTDDAMKYVQFWIKNSGSSFQTTLSADLKIISEYEKNALKEEEMNVSITTQEPVVATTKASHTSAHRLLALKYRIRPKTLLRDIFTIFGLDYDEISNNKRISNTDEETDKNEEIIDIESIGNNSEFIENSLKPSADSSSEQSLSPSYVTLLADNITPLGVKIDLFNQWFLASNPPVAKIKAVGMDNIRIGA